MSRPILITGAAGFIGSWLATRMCQEGDTVVALDKAAIRERPELESWQVDVRDAAALGSVIARVRPAVIYHLAAQSLPVVSLRMPQETMDINIDGTINVFEAVLRARRSADGYDPMIVIACSAAEYGAGLDPDGRPVDETAQLLPLHPYGVSKVAQDLLGFQYWKREGVRTIRARIFNTTGPGKTGDLCSDLAWRVAEVKRSGGKLRVGNLSPRRAYLDVRDLTEALSLLAARGEPGEAYNISAEKALSVREVIDIFQDLSGCALELAVDPALVRQADEPIIVGDTTKLRTQTGWIQQREIERTLETMLTLASG